MGIVIEESLKNVSVLQKMRIISTNVVLVNGQHKTPWLTQWTMHSVEIPDEAVAEVVTAISSSFDNRDNWYADFKSQREHYIVFPHKIFLVDRSKPENYREVIEYGLQKGIPAEQLDFKEANQL